MIYYKKLRKVLWVIIFFIHFSFWSALRGFFPLIQILPLGRNTWIIKRTSNSSLPFSLSQLLEVVFFLSRWDYIRGYLGLEKVGLEHTDDDLTNKEKYDIL